MIEPMSVPAETKPCTVHRNHGGCRPLRTVKHHILPLGWGGPDLELNWVWICDNGHYAVHRILDYLRQEDLKRLHGIETSMTEVMSLRPPFGGARQELRIAREGYRRWVVAGRPKLASSQ